MASCQNLFNCIFNCPKVKELYCSDNALTELDVGELTDLKIFPYDNNNLSDAEKAELVSLGLPTEGENLN